MVLALFLASCASRATEQELAAEPETDAPTRIVSLSPTATETLWAIGAGDQVIAVDDQSNYPEGVPRTKLSAYKPNVEAILGYEPDLVITSNDEESLVSGLEATGVVTLVQPAAASIDGAYTQIERIGAATGHVAEAAKLVAGMQTDIADAVDSVPEAEGLTYFHELDPTGFTATGGTFIGEVYGLFGLTSIADAAGSGDDYPQLSAEYVVFADPDLVLLADTECCGVTVEGASKRPGWSEISAVRNDMVRELDKDISSRWGPRVVDFVEVVAGLVAEVEQPAMTG